MPSTATTVLRTRRRVARPLDEAGDDHRVVRPRDRGERLDERAVDVLRVLGERLVERVDEVARVLGEDHEARAPIGCRRHELRDGVEVRGGVGGRGELRDAIGSGRRSSSISVRRVAGADDCAGATSHSTTMRSASGISAHHAAAPPTTTSKTNATTPTSSSDTVSSAVIRARVAVADDDRLRPLLEEDAVQGDRRERDDRAERREHDEGEVERCAGRRSGRRTPAGRRARAGSR